VPSIVSVRTNTSVPARFFDAFNRRSRRARNRKEATALQKAIMGLFRWVCPPSFTLQSASWHFWWLPARCAYRGAPASCNAGRIPALHTVPDCWDILIMLLPSSLDTGMDCLQTQRHKWHINGRAFGYRHSAECCNLGDVWLQRKNVVYTLWLRARAFNSCGTIVKIIQ
jgi:hypothetical protein